MAVRLRRWRVRPAPVVGLMVPSVDRVGRYFPLTVVAQLPLDANVVSAATRTNGFFTQDRTTRDRHPRDGCR